MSSPAHKIRFGNLSVTIWRNSSEKGVWYSVNPSRSYKKGDETWKETDSLGFDDLLPMAKLLDQAHSWIGKQMQADAKSRKARQEANSDDA
ncbi:hypothetical protein [Singulisphaera sp. PoT]|uniref:hypothetical protein n=1 Tax=Singulisphaera sp. PoT TaxID=3411797 RepID=UPI003BF55D06